MITILVVVVSAILIGVCALVASSAVRKAALIGFSGSLLILECALEILLLRLPVAVWRGIQYTIVGLMIATLLVFVCLMTGQKWGLIVVLVPLALFTFAISKIADVAGRGFSIAQTYTARIANRFGVDLKDIPPVDLGIAAGLRGWSYWLIFVSMAGLVLIGGNFHLSMEAAWGIALGFLAISMTFPLWQSKTRPAWKIGNWLIVLMVAILVLPEIYQMINPSMPSTITSLGRLTKAGVDQFETGIREAERRGWLKRSVPIQEKNRELIQAAYNLIEQRHVQVVNQVMARLKNKEFKIEELTAEIQKAIDSDQETIRLKAVAAKLGADPPTSNPRPSPDPQSAGVPGWVWIVGVLLGVLTLNALYNKRWVTAGVWTAVILGLYFYWPSLQQTSRSVFQGSGAPYYLGSPTAIIKPVTLPTDMAPKVKAAADKYGVPENLMAGVCWQESRCNPNVRDGSAGEIGPMQIMPSTAGGYGVDAKSLRDPDTNLDTGARVLKDCLNVVPGRLDLAVLCYNAGSDKAKKYATTPWSQIPPHELRGTRDGKPYDSHAYVTSVLNFTSSGGVGPGAVLAATPTTLSELSITVPSSAESGVMVLDQAGQPLVVQAGDTIEIIASNQVNIGRGLVDADGERGYADNSVDSPFKDRVGGLEMWIGPSKQANRYFAGKQFRHIVAHSGTVTLRVIESVRGYHDGNTGAFNVLVRKSPKEAS